MEKYISLYRNLCINSVKINFEKEKYLKKYIKTFSLFGDEDYNIIV